MKIVLAQCDFLVGAIEQNAAMIIEKTLLARDELKADMIVFPELALTGYPPEDLLLRPKLYDRVKEAIKNINQQINDIYLVFGYPELAAANVYNSLSISHNHQIIATYHKEILPNYSVFDEKRYFHPGRHSTVVNINSMNIAFMICEDVWHKEPAQQAKQNGAELIIVINASPYDVYKRELRIKQLQQRAQENSLPIIYLNTIGAQDELVFDGGSFAVNQQGEIVTQAPYFETALFPVTVQKNTTVEISPTKLPAPIDTTKSVYEALTLGIKDYVNKNNFPSVIIGLSGGIDSALTLSLAVDALGANRVRGVLMPSRYTSQLSIDIAIQQAEMLGVGYDILSIEEPYQAFLNTLYPLFKETKVDTTEENIQARCRGIMLMAISNKTSAMVLATGNKSEMSVGYATLYGDMVGGFCALKNVPKTLVYQLANYRNSISPSIPQAVIDRPPSAELAENQLDQDSLPPYPILDDILHRYIELDQSVDKILSAGLDETTVKRIIKMVDNNEYKRRQAAPGVRITERAFGRDRRYPITSGYLLNRV